MPWGRMAACAGPGVSPRAGSVRQIGPTMTRACPSSTASIVTSTRLASPMKSATKRLAGRLVELARRAVLRDAAAFHHDDAVGDGERLLLVVRHVDDGEVRATAAARGSPRAPGGAAWRRDWTAARRTAAPAARARARAPRRRAAAGRRTVRTAARSRSRRGRPARASPAPSLARLRLAERPAPRPVGDVLQHGHVREQRIGLEHHADVALGGGEPRHVLAADQDAARRWPISSPAIRRSVVVLPQPEGPSSVTSVPGSIVKETSSTAVTAP